MGLTEATIEGAPKFDPRIADCRMSDRLEPAPGIHRWVAPPEDCFESAMIRARLDHDHLGAATLFFSGNLP